MEISNLPGKWFKITLIKILTKLRRRMNEFSQNVKKEIKKNQSEMNNIIIEMKNTVEGINRLKMWKNESVI